MLIGIVADDLTGAADAVAPFAHQGYASGVELSVAAASRDAAREWDVLALNTDLRGHDFRKPTLIKSISRRATRRLIERAPQLYFKKIDSTLRGHLRLELDGMLRELPGRIALVCPASPANGRTVENGVLIVDGIPLAQTEFADGNEQAEKFATVRSAFEFADKPEAAEIRLAVIRQGTEAIEAEVDRCITAGARFLFCDAATSEDLRTLARVLLGRPERYLPVGSAGLTRAIAQLVPANLERNTPNWDTELFKRGRIMVIVGSMHSMSRLQVRRLIDRGAIEPFVLGQNGISGERKIGQAFRQRYREGERIFIIMTPEERHKTRREFEVYSTLWDMAMCVDMLSTCSPFDSYIVTGGDMALNLCNAWQGRSLQVFGEDEPGVVRAFLNRYHDRAGFPILLKAGGFGDENTLVRCVGLE